MPLYVYEVVNPDGTGGARFEVLQAMADAPLAVHPETGEPVRRIPTTASLPLRHGSRAEARRIGDKNLDRLGFTKYENVGNGRFERRTGAGPAVLSD
jgi:predicted nucleic acid-binding Zn ribbon protein